MERGTVRSWVGEAACGVALALLGLWLAFLSRRMPLYEDSVPGPGLAPLMLGLALAAFGIGIGVSAAVRRVEARVEVVDRDALLAIFLLVVAIGAFDGIGFIAATFLFLLSSFVLIGREPWLRAGIVAAVATGITWALFVKALGVALPAGLLGN